MGNHQSPQAASRSKELAIVGGSISYGSFWPGLYNQTMAYGNVVATNLHWKLHNAAVPATTSAHAAYCLDSLVPKRPDVLIVEYATNDAASMANPLETGTEGIDGKILTPKLTMERLLRRVWHKWPYTLVVLLNICRAPSPQSQTCKNVRGVYGQLPAIYVKQPLVQVHVHLAPTFLPANLSYHPNEAGHRLIASHVLDALQAQTARHTRHRHAPLPPPSFLAAGNGDDVDAPWACVSAAELAPAVSPRGFALRASEVTGWRKDKIGWVGEVAGDEATFRIGDERTRGAAYRCGLRLLAVMLCCGERANTSTSVGVATLGLSGRSRWAAPVEPQAVSRTVDLRWNAKSSQQCLHSLETRTAPPHTFSVRVPTPATGSVVLYSVYSQPVRCPSISSLLWKWWSR